MGLACRRNSRRHRDTLVLADGTLGWKRWPWRTGAVYDPINCGDVQVGGLRRALAGLSLSAWPDGGPAGRGCEKLAAA
jgi:hypothetical protein